jgi:stage II sporulation protein D
MDVLARAHGAMAPGRRRRAARRITRSIALPTAVMVLTGAAVLGPVVAGASTAFAAVPAVQGFTSGDVTLTGAGFGHGVGMSQYGAYGMALGGSTVQQILTHYYSGTTVVGHRDDVDLRVNIVDRGSKVTLSGAALAGGGGALELISAGGVTVDLPPGSTATVTPADGTLAVDAAVAGGAARTFSTSGLTVRWSGGRGMPGPASLLTVASRSANANSTWGKTRSYRWGSVQLSAVSRGDTDGTTKSRIEAVAVVNLHSEYLRGVAEMPSSWPDAALQAQVVAARNYALSAYQRGTLSNCGGCNLWDDTRSQVYQGWAKEAEPGYGSRWVTAVKATQTSTTHGLTVLYQGWVVTAYFSSSSGGRTRDSASAWGTAVPYLVSVADPWSIDPAVNPGYSRWTRSVAVSRLLSMFGLSDITRLEVSKKDAAGAMVSVTATASDGTARTVTGSAFSSGLGLPAPWVNAFTLPVTVQPPATPQPTGSAQGASTHAAPAPGSRPTPSQAAASGGGGSSDTIACEPVLPRRTVGGKAPVCPAGS